MTKCKRTHDGDHCACWVNGTICCWCGSGDSNYDLKQNCHGNSKRPAWADIPGTKTKYEPNTMPGPDLAIALLVLVIVACIVVIALLT